jgi:hypothetical protein
MDEFELWRLPDGIVFGDDDLDGFAVQAADGPLGSVIRASAEVGRSHVIVAARPWLATAMVMLPAALIEHIDRERAIVHVASDRAEISAAPPFAGDRFRDAAYRAELGFHYSRRRRAPLRMSPLAPSPPLPTASSPRIAR